MSSIDPTYIGQVASVTGGLVRIRLRQDMPTTLVLVEGESYRVGQIGGFFRIPIGYTQLYAVCSQVGADAMPPSVNKAAALEVSTSISDEMSGYRWMSVTLFGESVSGQFERGVGQYPTVGDEVHFITRADLGVIYGRPADSASITVGKIAASSGIPATLDLSKLVSRHTAVVGSTGAGKSNLIAVILKAISSPDFPSARVVVIDPHGEYSAIASERSKVFRISPGDGEYLLRIPFWALPFDELLTISFGGMSPSNEALLRDRIQELKSSAALLLANPPAPLSITADSPIPFSMKQLWFELDDFERQTFRGTGANRVKAELVQVGNANELRSNHYAMHGPGGVEPFKNPSPRGLSKQLELARSRLTDPRYDFLFNPMDGLTPNLEGEITSDLDSLIAEWIGSEQQLSIIDVSELPSEVAANVVGLLARVIYDTLFWAGKLTISGRSQPLLFVLDEAHRYLPAGTETAAHRALTRIAKEGRKYGMGMMVITQRPSEIDGTILSQCGTMIALRITNKEDRSKVAAAFPDDLGGLVDLLPSLRTGEGLFIGEAMFVPSRVRIDHNDSADGADPDLMTGWRVPKIQKNELYTRAVSAWRNQTKAKDD